MKGLGVNLEEAVEDIHHRSTKCCLLQAEYAKQDKRESLRGKKPKRVGNISTDKKMRGIDTVVVLGLPDVRPLMESQLIIT